MQAGEEQKMSSGAQRKGRLGTHSAQPVLWVMKAFKHGSRIIASLGLAPVTPPRHAFPLCIPINGGMVARRMLWRKPPEGGQRKGATVIIKDDDGLLLVGALVSLGCCSKVP